MQGDHDGDTYGRCHLGTSYERCKWFRIVGSLLQSCFRWGLLSCSRPRGTPYYSSLEVSTWMNTHPVNELRHAEQRTMRRRSSSSSETKGRGAQPTWWASCRGLCLPQCGTSLSCHLWCWLYMSGRMLSGSDAWPKTDIGDAPHRITYPSRW